MIYGDADKNQKPGLFYGLTVDGTQTLYYTYDGLSLIHILYGNQTSVSAGGTTLERTEYRHNNGLVNTVIYGDADKNQKPGLFYGLTVDGTQTLYLSLIHI